MVSCYVSTLNWSSDKHLSINVAQFTLSLDKFLFRCMISLCLGTEIRRRPIHRCICISGLGRIVWHLFRSAPGRISAHGGTWREGNSNVLGIADIYTARV